MAQAITRLQTRADADSLASAALLSVFSDRDAALTLAVQALQAEPNRPDLLWLTIGLCRDVPACASLKWDRRLEAVDPTNAAPHLDELRLASEAGDEGAQQAALDEIARSQRLDLYWIRLMVRGTHAALQTGALPLPVAQSAIVGGLSLILPPFRSLTRQCRDDALADPWNRDRCRQVAAVLQRGDTVITEMLGVAIARRAWPEDSAEWRAADNARRVFRYRASALRQDPLWMIHHADQLMALDETGREQELMSRQLVLMGVPPDPPAS